MTDPKTGNRRLLKLAAFLRKLPRKRFDYGVFVRDDWKGAPDLSCGTTACALGWATTIPSFRRLGLILDRETGTPTLRGRALNPFYAAGEVFGITSWEANALFSPRLDEDDATPKYVAKKIEQFVAERS